MEEVGGKKDFKQSVFNIKNYIWHDKMCSQKRLISFVFSDDCNMWTLWCLIKMPLDNTAAFTTSSDTNVSFFSAGVLRLSVLLLPKWRGESLECSKSQYLWI